MFGRFYKAAAFVDVAVMITRWRGDAVSVKVDVKRSSEEKPQFMVQKRRMLSPHRITVVQRIQKVQEKHIVRRNMPQCEMQFWMQITGNCTLQLQI